MTYSTIVEQGEPRNFEEATSGGESTSGGELFQWKQAMREEYASIVKNDTWKLCDLPLGEKVVGSRWVFNKEL